MNIIVSLIFSIFLMAHSGAADLVNGHDDLLEKRGSFFPPQELLKEDELNRALFNDSFEHQEELKKVKYYLINGETRLAQLYLSKLTQNPSRLRPVVYRYLGILSFIQGNFAKSFSYLEKEELQKYPHYPKICLLQTLNRIVLNKTIDLEDKWVRCQLENIRHLNVSKLIWLDILVQMKLYPDNRVTRVPFKYLRLIRLEHDELKFVLKLALYLGQEKMLEPQLNDLRVAQLQDPEVREILGHVYFRLGKFAKSYKHIEDLKTPNSENIKGNFYTLRKKYELAYAQYKLGLQQKQNSQNAMERLLPLAWLLGDWESGTEYAERVIASPQTQINKLTLLAAFLTQKGAFDKATGILDRISLQSQKGAHVDVTQLYSFAALMKNDSETTRKYAGMSCAQYDLVNCWVLFQLAQWDTFPLSIRRPDKLPVKKEWEQLIKEDIDRPLQETSYVNQLDIEEMDDEFIQLIQNEN